MAVVDRLTIPADLQPGKYVLGWRYDAESTQQVHMNFWTLILFCSNQSITETAPSNAAALDTLSQVWSNCADVTLALPESKGEEESLAAARSAATRAMAAVSFNPKPFSEGNALGRKERAALTKTTPPLDSPYGYPTNSAPCSELDAASARCSFGLVIEERGATYANGPSFWPDDPRGAYGMVVNAPAAFLDDRWGHNRTRCPAVPLDSPLFPRRADLQVSQSNQPRYFI